jgi:hypothetical protein
MLELLGCTGSCSLISISGGRKCPRLYKAEMTVLIKGTWSNLCRHPEISTLQMLRYLWLQAIKPFDCRGEILLGRCLQHTPLRSESWSASLGCLGPGRTRMGLSYWLGGLSSFSLGLSGCGNLYCFCPYLALQTQSHVHSFDFEDVVSFNSDILYVTSNILSLNMWYDLRML